MKNNIFAFIVALTTAFAVANAADGTNAPVDMLETGVGEFVIDQTGAAVTTVPSFAAAAGEEDVVLDYHYCGEPASGLATGEGIDIENTAAIILPEDVVNRYAGAEIVSVMICSGFNSQNYWVNNITDATAFVRYDIFDDEDDLSVQRGRLSRSAMTWSEITFSKPYKLEAGKPVYVGYRVIRPSGNDLPFVGDHTPIDSDYSFWIHYYNNGEYHWENWASLYGSLCMHVKLRGASLPVNDLEVMSLSVPLYVRKGSFNTTFRIRNVGANEITSIGYTCTVGDKTKVDRVLTLATPLKFSDATDVTVSLMCQEFGLEIPVSVTVTSINGVEDTDLSNNSQSRMTACLDPSMGYERRLVMEEGTGLWCPNCPRGLGSLDYMTEKYPDSFIGISIHQNDPMQIKAEIYEGHAYTEHILMLRSYPNARFNRNDDAYGNSINDFGDQVESIYNNIVAVPAAADISAQILFTDEAKEEITVLTETEFALETSTPYRIALVLTENEVGPYIQSNGYAGAGYDCRGWESLPSQASCLFNDVARYIDSHNGVEGSVPVDKKARTVYKYKSTLPTAPLASLDNFDVAALLINSKTGVIENAVKCHGNAELPLMTAINEVSVSDVAARVEAVAGGLNIKGDYGFVTVYNFNGSVVAEADGSDFIALPAGMYIVSVDGVVTEKVQVR